MLFQTTADEVTVVPSITQYVTEFDDGESTNGTEPTETRSEKSGGDVSNDHSYSNPDSDSEYQDGEPPDGTTGE
jgi:hypothetical protein